MSKKTNPKNLKPLLEFLEQSPTAWHAVAAAKQRLLLHGFQELQEKDLWQLEYGQRYFTVRNGSTICAFIMPAKNIGTCSIVAAHTDSPALKLKPNAEYSKGNMTMFGVELYGSPLLSSWLNRDLGIAGRISYLDKHGMLKESLVRIDDSPLVIPQLAIHLDRTVNDNGLILNKQEHLSALAAVNFQGAGSYLEQLLLKLCPSAKQLLVHDLLLYPLETARFVGAECQLLAGYRLDNLCSVFAGLEALLSMPKKSSSDHLAMVIFWDNEETGSTSPQGAASPFLPHLLERIVLSVKNTREDYLRLLHNALCISVDVAHAWHPNYPEKHDARHQPQLNSGVVLKFNAQQRYASDCHSASRVAAVCHKLKLPLQNFAARNDIPSGATVGPITAALTGIKTVDIGMPQLSMHSSRELVGCQDQLQMTQLLQALLQGALDSERSR